MTEEGFDFSALDGPTAVFAAHRGDFSLLAARLETGVELDQSERSAIAAILRKSFKIDKVGARRERLEEARIQIAGLLYALVASGIGRKRALAQVAKHFGVSERKVDYALEFFKELPRGRRERLLKLVEAIGRAWIEPPAQTGDPDSA